MNYNKKTQYIILLSGLVMVSLMIPGVAAQPQTGHPFLLFHDISEVPGYQYRTIEPWKGWEAGIISGADASLSRNFSANLSPYDDVDFRGGFARDLGMAYQITKKPQYSLKAKEALVNMEVGYIGSGAYANSNKARALAGYSLAYDWVQPTLDPATDILIRDKLATLGNTVYQDLNANGTNMIAISFGQQGQSYPTMGVASAVLYDYTNPNHLPISSTPAIWHRVGREYLFENDLLHSHGKSLFSFGFDEVSGKYLNGAYKMYVMDDLALWFQVSNNTFGENLLDIYPAAKKGMTSEVWESLPNEYSDNYATNGNTKWIYQKAIVSLLPDNEKSVVLNHIDRIENSKLLPYSDIMAGGFQGGTSSTFLYCVYGNYAAINRAFPATPSHLDPNAITQLIRENWNDDADWLSLITFNKETRSDRDMQHHDQLSFEYYSRGDLLLADAGEDRFVLDAFYGTSAAHHNTIAIEDPRTPFPTSPFTGSAAHGIYKGDAWGLVTPPTVDTIIQVPWIQALQTHVAITKVPDDMVSYGKLSLSSPIQYTRSILYPDSDYFIIVDRMEGTEPWTYNNIFRPTSLMITRTTDANNDHVFAESEVGHVNGDLSIGSNSFNWQDLPYKKETPTGKTTNTISWATKNPYGKDVNLDIVSAPASEILVTKLVGRIAGYSTQSEVFSPVVYLKSQPATSEYRVTALLSRYTTETAKNATEIAVTGTGHAIKVSSASSDDFIYTGKGTSSFAGFTTDADTVYIRKQGNNREYTLINGSFLKEVNISRINMTRKVDLLTLKQEGTVIKFKVKGTTSADIRMEQTMADRVVRDGVAYSQWTMENNSTTLKISTTLSEHDFEVSSVSRLNITSLSNQTVNASEKLTFPLKYTYTGSGTVQSMASTLPKYAAFNTTSGIFSWIPYANQTGNYTVTFNVTDGRLSDSKKVFIMVNAVNRAPVLEQIGNKTVNASTRIQFAVNATDPDGDALSYSATGVPANATFNPGSRIFSWIPYTNQTGSHTVTFNVTDGRLSDSKKVLITVNAVNRAPVLEQIGNKTVNSGSATQFIVLAMDPDGDLLTYSASGLPANASFNATSRSFAWTPGNFQTGMYNVTFATTDGTLSDNETIRITVNSINRAPVITPVSAKRVKEGQTVAIIVTATDPDGDILTYSVTDLPTNASFNPATRTFTWTPGYARAGVYNVSFRVTDGNLTDIENGMITVNHPVKRVPGMPSKIGVYQNGAWSLDWNGNGTWETGTDKQYGFGAPGWQKVRGDWNGDGTEEIGIYQDGSWYLDWNGNGIWDAGTDKVYGFGAPGWVPVVGDWNGDGTDKIGIYNAGGWYLDYSGVGVYTHGVTKAYGFGAPGWVPVVGDWNGDGTDKIGIYNAGEWYLDYTGTGVYTPGVTKVYGFGAAGWRPVTGDWNGDGTDKIGIYNAGEWYLDYTGTGVYTPGVTKAYGFGAPGWVPVTGDWNGDGTDKIGIYNAGGWYLDYTGNGRWGPGDFHYLFGKTGDIPVVGKWNSVTDTNTVKVIVNNLNRAPVISPVPAQTVDEGQALVFIVTATDPDGDTLTYTATDLPMGAAFDPATQAFSWTPGYSQAGTYTVTFSGTDGSLTDTATAVITVRNLNRAPVISPVPAQTVDEGQALVFIVTATDPDGDTLAYTATDLPPGAAFDPTTQAFSWTPGYSQAGTYTLTLSVNDGGITGTETVVITVADYSQPQDSPNKTRPVVFIKLE